MIYPSVLDTIGNTPLISIDRFCAIKGLSAKVYAKTESRNPGGSAKDRIALAMIRDAEESGKLSPGGTIIEATSGNTGIGLAMAASVLGYHLVLTMPETMSVERQKILRAFGAELVLTPGPQGMAGSNDKAEELLNQIPGSIRILQFENPANPSAHFHTTGPEIWRDTDKRLDAFVATVGTGGTLSGVGRYLKEQNEKIGVYGVQPAESPILTGGQPGPHGIQGIGPNFVPQNYDSSVVDDVFSVTTEEALETAQLLMKTEGLLCGISSGAAAYAAAKLASRPDMAGKTIVVLLTDTGERYLSTKLFDV